MLACLRGWHPALAQAELAALLPTAVLSPTVTPRWWSVQQTTADQRREALAVASGLQCFLREGVLHTVQEQEHDEWLKTMKTYLSNHRVDGTVAVRSWKQGEKLPGWGPTTLAKRLGGMLHDMGYTLTSTGPTT